MTSIQFGRKNNVHRIKKASIYKKRIINRRGGVDNIMEVLSSDLHITGKHSSEWNVENSQENIYQSSVLIWIACFSIKAVKVLYIMKA